MRASSTHILGNKIQHTAGVNGFGYHIRIFIRMLAKPLYYVKKKISVCSYTLSKSHVVKKRPPFVSQLIVSLFHVLKLLTQTKT